MHSLTTRVKVVLHYTNFTQSLRKVAALYGVSKSSVSRWVQSNKMTPIVQVYKNLQRKRFSRKGSKAILLKETVAETLDLNPSASAIDLVTAAKEVVGIRASLSTVARVRKACGFRFKQASRSQNHQRASMDHPFMTTKNVYDDAIAVDESSFLKRDMPRRGWALGAAAVPKPPPKHHRERVSLILAIDKSGVVASQMKKGSFNTQSYASFLQSLPVGRRIIADNVTFHKSRHVREVAEANNQELVYTPPYCPWFNPTEFAFSVTKREYRRLRLEHGSDLFEQDVANALGSLSETKCDAFFRHAAHNVSLELQLAANEHRGSHS